jgi:hypothetical protein
MSKFKALENFQPFDKLGINEMYLSEVKITEAVNGKKENWEFIFKNGAGVFSVKQYFNDEGQPNGYMSSFLKQVHEALGNGKETVMQCLDRVEGKKECKCFIVGKLEDWENGAQSGTSIKLGYIGKKRPDDGIVGRFAAEYMSKVKQAPQTAPNPDVPELPTDENGNEIF